MTLSIAGHLTYDRVLELLRERGDPMTLQAMQAAVDLARALDRNPVDLDEAERLAGILEIEVDDLEE